MEHKDSTFTFLSIYYRTLKQVKYLLDNLSDKQMDKILRFELLKFFREKKSLTE